MQDPQNAHLDLLHNMGELTGLVTGDSDIETFLDKTVHLVATHLNAHVCSIYLFEEGENLLILKATQGLNPDAVDFVRMKPGEGLVGHCFQTQAVIREGNAPKNPNFKYFDRAGEDPFNSFLCIPIQRGMERIGELVVQHRDLDHFTADDERTLKTAVTQVAGALASARLLMEIDIQGTGDYQADLPAFISGMMAVGGPTSGKSRIMGQNRKSALYGPAQPHSPYTKDDFKRALSRTTQELKSLQDEFAKRLPESATLIFTAHFMILKDKNFTGKMAALMDQGIAPLAAVKKVARKYIALFSSSPHAYMREKTVDVEDLTLRILSNFTENRDEDDLVKGSIVIAPELYPSDMLRLAASNVKGIVLAAGGTASHVTILSRSLGISLIIVDDTRLLKLPEDTPLYLDTAQKSIYIDPAPETLAFLQIQNPEGNPMPQTPLAPKTQTRDGERVTLLANVNLLNEVEAARRLNADGVGLYRTEFPFLIRSAFPSENEQYLIYRKLLDGMGPAPVTIRTLDAGGEKALPYSGISREANPELGLRSIRFSLRYREIFETQIRAILRAGRGRDQLGIMFPLISSVDEFIQARKVVDHCIGDLKKEGIPAVKQLDIGMMIELPSVLGTLDEFADLADFFAVGTNDLVQYLLGADRANRLVANHYIPHHPAVNRALDAIARAAEKAKIPVSVCGEMAHDPDYIPFLLGVGIRKLSVDPQFLREVQTTISGFTMAQARSHAARMLAQTRVADTAQVLKGRPGN
ncbi:MAG: phosphoenolpyruvate--protein phosphotransferase [Desulfobacterales bacterium]|nr:phosphoenolpyruvate--protein phosphotransferase [Desulfobacterales bacterium]